MNLPPEFISNIQNTFQEDGLAFLKALPELIAEASARWSLTDIRPAQNLSYNFMAFAERASTMGRRTGPSAQREINLLNSPIDSMG